MAQAKGPMVNIHGVLGDIVFAHRGKKTYLRSRPSKSKNPPNEITLAKQASFGLAGKIASKISSIEEIKHFWEPLRTGNQTSYNCIFKANHQKSEIEKLKWEIILSPGDGFEALNPSITIGESCFFIEWNLTENKDMKKPEEVKYIISAGVIALKKPTDVVMPEYLLMKFKTKIISVENGGKFSAEIIYNGEEMSKFQGYTIKKIFGVFISMDGNRNLLEISNTFTNKI